MKYLHINSGMCVSKVIRILNLIEDMHQRQLRVIFSVGFVTFLIPYNVYPFLIRTITCFGGIEKEMKETIYIKKGVRERNEVVRKKKGLVFLNSLHASLAINNFGVIVSHN